MSKGQVVVMFFSLKWHIGSVHCQTKGVLTKYLSPTLSLYEKLTCTASLGWRRAWKGLTMKERYEETKHSLRIKKRRVALHTAKQLLFKQAIASCPQYIQPHKVDTRINLNSIKIYWQHRLREKSLFTLILQLFPSCKIRQFNAA